MCRGPLDLRELRPASGGPWGSTYVDEQFKAFMNELLGGRLDSSHSRAWVRRCCMTC